MENHVMDHADNVKAALLQNDAIEDTLHVIAVVSNPCNFNQNQNQNQN